MIEMIEELDFVWCSWDVCWVQHVLHFPGLSLEFGAAVPLSEVFDFGEGLE